MKKPDLDQKRISRYFSGSYSQNEESYVSEIFCDKSKEHELKSFLAEQFNELSFDDELPDRNLDHILYKIVYDIQSKNLEPTSRTFDRIVKWTFRIAGIVVLPLALMFALYTFRNTQVNKEYWVEISAPAWTRAQFTLPDSTTGWLNSNSSIRYNGDFNRSRQVTLNGEAFFDVYEDKERPFIVNTKEVTVKVLGTRFNMASYDNESEVEVVLEEGKLLFMNQEQNNSYTMKPNDMVVYDKMSKELVTAWVQPEKYTSWTEGKLIFRNDPIDVVARRLERWYNVDVLVDLKSSEDIRWRATFLDESLEEVLAFLKSSLPLDYKIETGNLGPDSIYNKPKVTISRTSK